MKTAKVDVFNPTLPTDTTRTSLTKDQPQTLDTRMEGIFEKVGEAVEGFFGGGGDKHDESHEAQAQSQSHNEESQGAEQTKPQNRYQSFAPQTSGHAKWHVDGCSYFWALSEAIEGEIHSEDSKSRSHTNVIFSSQRLKRAFTSSTGG